MMGAWRRLKWCGPCTAWWVAALCACHDEPASQRAQPGQLAPGVVAQVGTTDIRGSAVARISREQKIDLPAARERAIYDALLAAGARAGPEGNRPGVGVAVRGVLSSALLRELWTHARQSPIDDVELATWTERRWIDVDRPEGARTVQAVAIAGEGAAQEVRAQAKRLAEQWRAALGPARDEAQREPPPTREERDRFRTDPRRWSDPAADAFLRAVQNVAAEGVPTQSGVMPVIAADGRVMDLDWPGGSTFVSEYARAAHALQARGELSAVVESVYGYHVIMLLERLPARRLSEAQRRQELQRPIWQDRVEQQRKQLLERLQAETGVQVATNADALLELVSVEP